jgi:hypothetical protein
MEAYTMNGSTPVQPENLARELSKFADSLEQLAEVLCGVASYWVVGQNSDINPEHKIRNRACDQFELIEHLCGGGRANRLIFDNSEPDCEDVVDVYREAWFALNGIIEIEHGSEEQVHIELRAEWRRSGRKPEGFCIEKGVHFDSFKPAMTRLRTAISSVRALAKRREWRSKADCPIEIHVSRNLVRVLGEVKEVTAEQLSALLAVFEFFPRRATTTELEFETGKDNMSPVKTLKVLAAKSFYSHVLLMSGRNRDGYGLRRVSEVGTSVGSATN